MIGYALITTANADEVLGLVGGWVPYYQRHRDVIAGLRLARAAGLPIVLGDVWQLALAIAEAENRGRALLPTDCTRMVACAPLEYVDAVDLYGRVRVWHHMLLREQCAAGVAAAEAAEEAA